MGDRDSGGGPRFRRVERDDGEDYLVAAPDAGVDQLRSTAKWLIAALAAVGSLLATGTQLSSLGRLDASSGRLHVAIAALAAALLGVAYCIGQALRVLEARPLNPALIAV